MAANRKMAKNNAYTPRSAGAKLAAAYTPMAKVARAAEPASNRPIGMDWERRIKGGPFDRRDPST